MLLFLLSDVRLAVDLPVADEFAFGHERLELFGEFAFKHNGVTIGVIHPRTSTLYYYSDVSPLRLGAEVFNTDASRAVSFLLGVRVWGLGFRAGLTKSN